MAQDSESGAHEPLEAIKTGWRFRLGLVFFALAFVSPVGVPLVALTDLSPGLKATLAGLSLAGLPEVFTLAAVAFLGKSGFHYLTARTLAGLRRFGPPQVVSRTRYRIGIGMLMIPWIFSYLIAYAPQQIPGYAEYRLSMNLAMDFIFIASFFVLGGEFWDKFRALFIHGAKVEFPAR